MNGDAQAALFEFRTATASRLETNPRQIAPVEGRVRDKSRLTRPTAGFMSRRISGSRQGGRLSTASAQERAVAPRPALPAGAESRCKKRSTIAERRSSAAEYAREANS